ncbi:CPBP family intramembrane metalloprotease [Acaryochloris sp. 'Moss Beach']|uniref:CPBP family intramembrane glutamic endopeptidase n=1 Tax=Acaryochloris TaxID=155977 RepID=UPI001BB01082|nr:MULTISPECIES: CPBP family intramembrane glutamic endopeptidase [Acaryochloris]QUY42254.1 CPBP family intramembrane metalloprotease [Acaryochloris marina S15]UJB71364.1 CPBP family intramembrane metalloprotease [Acaryochloris sp. 'Moss Beach']
MVDRPNQQPELESLTRTQVLIAMGVTALLLLFLAKVIQYFGSFATLPMTWQLQNAVLGIGIGLGITAASAVIYQLWPQYRLSASLYLQLVIQPLVWTDLIWLGLLPGLSEELLFRGVIFPWVGLNWVGLILSSIVFGVLHLNSPQQWSYVVWVTVVGFVLGYSAWSTGNLLVPVIAHLTTNIITGVSWKITHPPQHPLGKT